MHSVGLDYGQEFVNICLNQTLDIFRRDEYWMAVCDLASMMLGKVDFKLDRNEIEVCLKSSGLIT